MLPGISINRIEGSATSVQNGSRLPLVIGPAISGSSVQGNAYIVSKTSALYGSANFGYGAGCDLVAELIEDAGGSVVFIPYSGSIAAPAITVASSSIGAHDRVKLEGESNNDYQFVFKALSGSITNGLKCQYSLDGGLNYSPPLMLSASAGTKTYELPNTSLSVVVSGTFTVNELFTADCIPATLNGADHTAAFAIISAQRNYIGGTPKAIYVANSPLTNVQGALNASAINTALTTLANNDIRTNVMFTAQKRPTATTTAGKAADGQDFVNSFLSYSNSTANSICLCTGFANITNPSGIVGCGAPRRSSIEAVAGRFSKVDVNTNPAWKPLGALPRVVSTKTLTIQSPSYDEYVDGEFYTSDTNKCIGLRTYNNTTGVYLTNDQTRCATGSTYKSWHRGRVVNLVSDVVQASQDNLINDQVNLVDGTNTIDPVDASGIEDSVNGDLLTAIGSPVNKDNGKRGYCSAIEYTVDKQHDMSDEILYSTVRVVPKGDIKNVVTTVSFERSASGQTVVVR